MHWKNSKDESESEKTVLILLTAQSSAAVTPNALVLTQTI